MSLRFKVTLWLLAILVPVTIAFGVYRVAVEKRYVHERQAERLAGRLLERPPAGCTNNPQRWRMNRRGLLGFAYDAQLRPQNPDAPAFPSELAEVMQADEPVHIARWLGPFSGATAIRTGLHNDCAVIVLHWRSAIGGARVARTVLTQAGILIVLLAATGTIIAYPIVHRIRRLTDEVAHAPDRGYRVASEIEAQDELGDLARAFDSAGQRVARTIDDLRKRDETLAGYIANTTHDLAIPVTVLAHQVRKMQELEPADAFAPLLRTAAEEIDYISSLIRNLAVSAKLEASEVYFRPHPHDLVEVVERIAARMQSIAAHKDIELNCGLPDEPLIVNCDATLVEQAVSNLVQNAIQYGRPGGHVALVLDASTAGFELQVIDDGPGIAPEQITDVVRPKFRSQAARDRRPEGSGLGLSIAHEICQLHGWRLTLANVMNELEPARSQTGLEARISFNTPHAKQ